MERIVMTENAAVDPLEAINAECDEIDVQIRELNARKKALNEQRVAIGKEAHAAYYGLSAEDYDQVKQMAKASASEADDPEGDQYRQSFAKLLGKARKAKAVQIAG